MTEKPGWQGRYFEDFEVGDVYRHRIGRTITDVDNAWFTLLTHNTNQMHFNAPFAARSTFGKMLVNSGFTLALVTGMTVSDISENAVANLGWDEVRLPHPLFVGDSVWAESLVTSKRPSASRPYAGIVGFRTRGMNQDGKVCITFRRTILIYKRDAPQDKDVFPEPDEPIAP